MYLQLFRATDIISQWAPAVTPVVPTEEAKLQTELANLLLAVFIVELSFKTSAPALFPPGVVGRELPR